VSKESSWNQYHLTLSSSNERSYVERMEEESQKRGDRREIPLSHLFASLLSLLSPLPLFSLFSALLPLFSLLSLLSLFSSPLSPLSLLLSSLSSLSLSLSLFSLFSLSSLSSLYRLMFSPFGRLSPHTFFPHHCPELESWQNWETHRDRRIQQVPTSRHHLQFCSYYNLITPPLL